MSFENVHNYYERLVREEIQRVATKKPLDVDEATIEDIGCVALNQLPPRYVRHDVDLVFYLSSKERQEMSEAVTRAVADAIDLVSQHKRAQ